MNTQAKEPIPLHTLLKLCALCTILISVILTGCGVNVGLTIGIIIVVDVLILSWAVLQLLDWVGEGEILRDSDPFGGPLQNQETSNQVLGDHKHRATSWREDSGPSRLLLSESTTK